MYKMKNRLFVIIITITIVVSFLVSVVFAYFAVTGKKELPSLPTNTSKKADEPKLISLTIGDQQINVEVSDSAVLQAKGLSGREALESGQGMLFVFNQKDVRPSFWMKGMLIPIDIIWIKDGKVAQIDADAQPELGIPDEQLKLYLPNDPIDYVLEVQAGFAEKFEIIVGTPVNFTL